MELFLVSAGDDIKIWDCNGFVLVKQFNPHDQNISSVCWSHDSILYMYLLYGWMTWWFNIFFSSILVISG